MLPTASRPPHAGLLQPVRRGAIVLGGVMGIVGSIVAVLWFLLQWIILPRLQAWQPELEQWTSRSLGVPVRIQELAVDGDLWAPVITLKGLAILGEDGRPAFELPQVRATLTPGSLLPQGWRQWHPHLQRIELQGPDLVVRRDAQGTLSIAGIPLKDASDPRQAQAAADWVFTQGEWVIRDGRLHWIDEQGSTPPPPVSFDRVDLTLTHRRGRHQLQLAATPPDHWGQRLAVSADMRSTWWNRFQRPGDWMTWHGTVHVDLPHANLAALRPYLPPQEHLRRGIGAVRADLDIDRSILRRASAQIALSDLELRWDTTHPTLDVRSLTGLLEVDQRRDRDWRFTARQLTLVRVGDDPQQPTWPSSDLSLRLKGELLQWTDGEAQATLLDLQSLARLSTFIPLPRAVRRSIDDLRPVGTLHEVLARWEGPLDVPRRWSVRGQGQQLGWADKASERSTPAHPLPGRPGLSGGDITFQANQDGGQAIVRMRKGALSFPGVFEEPTVPLEQLDAEIHWTLSRPSGKDGPPQDVRVDVRRAAFVNPDTRGEFSGSWQTGDGRRRARLPGALTLDAQVEQVQASRVHRYLPLQIPASTREYVREGMKEGHARQVRARVRGPLDDFPWPNQQGGEFRISAQVDGLTYDVAPTPDVTQRWPVLTQVRGELLFEGQGMRVRRAQALIGRSGSGQFHVKDVQASIADYVRDDVLRIDGQGAGPLADALHFVAHSPVSGWLQHALDPAQASGPAALRLSLQLPLSHLELSRVQGRVTLQNNSLALHPDAPRLEQARGQVLFDEKGFRLEGAQAQGLGGPVVLTGGSLANGTVQVRGRGTASAAGLRSASELGWIASLAQFMTGQADYDLDLRFDRAGMHLDIRSPLTGLALQAPAPLGKEAGSSLPLHVQIRPAEGGEAPRGVVAESVRVEMPKVLTVHYVREAQAPYRALKGAVQVGMPGTPTLPGDQSVRYAIDLPSADVEEWLAWQDRATHAGVLDARPDAPDLGYRPNNVQFRTPRLTLGTRTLTHVQAQLHRETWKDGQGWSGTAQADQLAGQVLALLPNDPRQPPQIKARLSRLNLSSDDAGPRSHSASTGGTAAPAHAASADHRLPTLDVEADRFELDGKPLGRLVLKAGHQNELQGPGAWMLQNLTLTQPDAQLQAVGRWLSPMGGGSANHTRLSFRLQVGDGGALLSRFGQSGALRGGKGQLSGQIGWQGSPTQFNIASLDGQIQIDLGRGQFLRAEPGVGRLLGVLSLQSLPRRLLFDFRDVFQEGFSFDRIDGQVRIARGVASTHNLRIRGVQAMVLTEGQADLDRETQDLKVWVVPDINAGAASLAYAVINPAVGLGTLLGQMFLSKPLTEAATREFHITGRWETPQVTAVKQRSPAPIGPPPDDAPDTASPLSEEAEPSVRRSAEPAALPAPNTAAAPARP